MPARRHRRLKYARRRHRHMIAPYVLPFATAVDRQAMFTLHHFDARPTFCRRRLAPALYIHAKETPRIVLLQFFACSASRDYDAILSPDVYAAPSRARHGRRPQPRQ